MASPSGGGTERKRKRTDHDDTDVVYDNGALTLSLALPTTTTTAGAAFQPLPSTSPQQHISFNNQPLIIASPPETTGTPVPRLRGERRNPTRTPPEGKSAIIPPPYPWSDVGRATIRSLSYLRQNQISEISGEVQCKKCDRKLKLEFNLEQKFSEISTFIIENRDTMRERAPCHWKNPALPKCGLCNQENSVRPVIAPKKREINWLFLLLGQMIGCCTLEQLKYFCKHTKNHRTGAKDRVIFLAYMGLCKQLDPNGPYHV